MKRITLLLSVTLLLAVVLGACSPPGTAEPTDVPAEPTEEMAEPTEEMAEPTEEMVEPTEEMAEPTEEVAEPTEEMGLVCEEPIKVGLITDGTGALAIYGAHILRSFMLGMEYATGAPGSVGDVFTLADGRKTFML